MVRVVLDVVFGTFHLPDKTFGYVYPVGQHGLGDVLAFPLFADSIDDVLIDRVYHSRIVSYNKTMQLIKPCAYVYLIDAK